MVFIFNLSIPFDDVKITGAHFLVTLYHEAVQSSAILELLSLNDSRAYSFMFLKQNTYINGVIHHPHYNVTLFFFFLFNLERKRVIFNEI